MTVPNADGTLTLGELRRPADSLCGNCGGSLAGHSYTYGWCRTCLVTRTGPRTGPRSAAAPPPPLSGREALLILESRRLADVSAGLSDSELEDLLALAMIGSQTAGDRELVNRARRAMGLPPLPAP